MAAQHHASPLFPFPFEHDQPFPVPLSLPNDSSPLTSPQLPHIPGLQQLHAIAGCDEKLHPPPQPEQQHRRQHLQQQQTQHLQQFPQPQTQTQLPEPLQTEHHTPPQTSGQQPHFARQVPPSRNRPEVITRDVSQSSDEQLSHPLRSQESRDLPSPHREQLQVPAGEKVPVPGHESDSSGATLSDNDDMSNSCSQLVKRVAEEKEDLPKCRDGSQSPLEASPPIASHPQNKRKDVCMETVMPAMNPVPASSIDATQASHSQIRIVDQSPKPTIGDSQETNSKKKKLKQVQFQLDALTYQKFMKLLSDQYEGNFQRFVMASVNADPTQDKAAKKTFIRKPALSKWKRTRFDQLKGNETQELALAFRSLAESIPGAAVTLDLMETPWQELNMAQVEKMLEETKKMLIVNERVHDCPHADCGRRFSTPGNLRDHLNEHSGEQPYSCSFEDCPHRFRSKQLLCRHLKKHERAHMCMFEGCNKRFAFRERLIVHQKTHSDERPLTCPWEGCGKTFKWPNSLHGHLRTHTGEKPFQCTFSGCGRLFGYKVDLTRHRRTHFGQPARSSH